MQAYISSRDFFQIEKSSNAIKESKGLNPDTFCQTWIPKIYGIQPGKDLYRDACFDEFKKYLPDEVVTRSTMEKTWNWDSKVVPHRYPKYLPAILLLAHQRYVIMETLGVLPQITKERKSN